MHIKIQLCITNSCPNRGGKRAGILPSEERGDGKIDYLSSNAFHEQASVPPGGQAQTKAGRRGK